MSCKNMDYREFKKETHRLTPLGLLLAKHIRFHANSIGVCWERHKTMAEETNLCQRTIRCHLRELVDAMILVAFPRHRADGVGRAANTCSWPATGMLAKRWKARPRRMASC